MEESDRSRKAATSIVRGLVRRVLRSGGTDLDAVEELVFLQKDDALHRTATSVQDDRAILELAFHAELAEYIAELIADDRLTVAESVRLRSSLMAASGPRFDPQRALAPFEQILASGTR